MNKFFGLLLFSFLLLAGCKNAPAECKEAKIRIENRWYDENGGINELDVKDNKDILFICSRMKNLGKGRDVRISYNYGYLTILLNHHKTDMIFTVENGVVYRVGIGKYVHDEALTKRIMKIMKISDRCWGKDCK